MAQAATCGTATLHEAGGRRFALSSIIKPLDADRSLVGRAFPVRSTAGSNLALHHAILAAQPGQVLVVDVGDGVDFGYWGEVMTVAAQQRGVAGLVLNGRVRDKQQIISLGFPVFSAGVSINGTGKLPERNTLGEEILLGTAAIADGDLVVGDADGVVVIPWGQAETVIVDGIKRDAAEQAYFQRLYAGESTIDIYNLPPLAGSTPPAPARQSIEVEGLSHGRLPIPAASRLRGVVATGGVRGVDPATGALSADPRIQAEHMFANLRAILFAAGASTTDLVKLTIWITDAEVRDCVSDPWLKMFPDPHSRPARHILTYALPGGMRIQCEALAVLPHV